MFFFCFKLIAEINSDYLDLGFGRGSHMSASSRAKRMRTSFKHHQLRTMKSYFAINHNPDAKDLKQLSQKTGLPKRVLQVWYELIKPKPCHNCILKVKLFLFVLGFKMLVPNGDE